VKSKLSAREENPVPAKKAGLLQVAATIFWGLFMIGRKGTWEKEGAVVSLPQVIVGAFIGAGVVVLVLITIVKMVLSQQIQG